MLQSTRQCKGWINVVNLLDNICAISPQKKKSHGKEGEDWVENISRENHVICINPNRSHDRIEGGGLDLHVTHHIGIIFVHQAKKKKINNKVL